VPAPGRSGNCGQEYLRTHPLGQVFIAPCDVYLSAHDVVQSDVLFVAQAHRDQSLFSAFHSFVWFLLCCLLARFAHRPA
jgi:hypothetical protein